MWSSVERIALRDSVIRPSLLRKWYLFISEERVLCTCWKSIDLPSRSISVLPKISLIRLSNNW